MLVDGAGQLKMTKDGKVLLSEMQIQVRSSPRMDEGETELTTSRRTLPPLLSPEQQSRRTR